MVVDDSPFIHKAVQKALVPEGYQICGTGRNDEEIREEAKEAGVSRFASRPFTNQELLDEVQLLLKPKC